MIVEIIKAASIPLAMVLVGLLTWAAMNAGIDGAIFMIGLTVIGGLGGYEVKTIANKIKAKSNPSSNDS